MRILRVDIRKINLPFILIKLRNVKVVNKTLNSQNCQQIGIINSCRSRKIEFMLTMNITSIQALIYSIGKVRINSYLEMLNRYTVKLSSFD